ncbi:type IX secretion system outer membrane channel protein PorV [Flavobacterium agrisoli]|uniref:Type IX secretion system outer membrane channel protein PorV n=1 Tax=Flavobacterium agrisoli TaxID=2793066 RepID=A0A934UKJ1_9FLAO|nr:type IX secretion system outer membrane channel protein PorV [Flavobacterium agrisoli]MBK0371027.1 type IX secretion system outer membrane channel protein PorV [Flavobacterium agrisoli]
MKKLAIVTLILVTQFIKAQERPISPAVPFLLVAADARAAGMGDSGVATATDAFSQQWNPAKYAFAVEQQGFSVSYTPYLTDLANDISLGQITYYNKINERSAFAGSFRYFGLGDIELRQTGDPNEQFVTVSPNDFALDGSYTLKLSETFSMAVAGRYVRSNLKIASIDTDSSPASTFAVDVAGFYQSEEIAYQDFNGRWRAGFNFQNMGPKISYDNQDLNSNFIPANMRLGGGFDFIFDDYNKLAVNVEFSKLMVPTPKVGISSDGSFNGEDMNGDGVVDQTDFNLSEEEYQSTGWFSGMFKSFLDAPDGFSEELKEVAYSVGAEYMYQDAFAMRLGYFHESPLKGARQFFSLGAGFKYNVIKVDVSYLFSASKVRNPLENTLRFSLTFNFGDKYEVY